MKKHLAVDMGSSGVKIVLLWLEDGEYRIEQVKRFPTPRIVLNGTVRINTFLIFQEICETIRELAARDCRIDSLGVDTWTSDFALVDRYGEQIGLPVFYRDKCFDGAWALVESRITYDELYRLTTQRKMRESTLCQLAYTAQKSPELLRNGTKLMFLGDLLMSYFTGKICSEITAASYSQMFDMRKRCWQDCIFERFSFAKELQPEIVEPGQLLGSISDTLAEYLTTPAFRIIAPATHDTSSAVAAVPAREGESWAFIATGSWFLVGMELDQPADCERSMRLNCSNTGLAFGRTMLKRNVTAMWLLQECKRCWEATGRTVPYSEIAERARQAEPFFAMIDPEDAAFVHPQNMPTAISEYLRAHGQQQVKPNDIGQIARIIYESVALASACALAAVEYAGGKKADTVYAVGGASRVDFLNQMLASSTGRVVVTGPEEASAIGNGLLQAYGAGEIASAEELRAIVRASNREKRYLPQDREEWLRRLGDFCRLCRLEMP